MFTDIDGFLRYFRSVNRRAVRDVTALPPEADGWTPVGGEGENTWSINKLIGHMCGSRLYFASAYRREGWINPEPPDVSSPELWAPALDASFEEFSRLVSEVGAEGLTRQIEMIDTPWWHAERLASVDDDAGARHPPPLADRYLCGTERLGSARYLLPLRRDHRRASA